MASQVWRPPLTATFIHRDHAVELIPIGPQHRQLLADSFGQLSERSRYYRFMAPMTQLSDADLAYLTDLDMVDHFAWGVLIDGHAAGVGRYARAQPGSRAAEVGMTILDDYQGKGLGTLLVECLGVVARAAGYTAFEFEVLSENTAMLTILERLGAALARHDGVVHAEVPLSNVPEPIVEPRVLVDVVESARTAPAG
ncbi:hypothetical protein BH23ACT5_BH23ACT5_09750 [soil metagenome]